MQRVLLPGVRVRLLNYLLDQPCLLNDPSTTVGYDARVTFLSLKVDALTKEQFSTLQCHVVDGDSLMSSQAEVLDEYVSCRIDGPTIDGAVVITALVDQEERTSPTPLPSMMPSMAPSISPAAQESPSPEEKKDSSAATRANIEAMMIVLFVVAIMML